MQYLDVDMPNLFKNDIGILLSTPTHSSTLYIYNGILIAMLDV